MNILLCEQTEGQMLQAARHAVAYIVIVLVHSSNDLQNSNVYGNQITHVCTQLGPPKLP